MIERDIIVVQNLVLLYAVIFVASTCWSTSATRGSIPGFGTADARVARRARRFARRNTLAAAGAAVGVAIIVVAVAAPLLAPRDPLKADFRRMNKPPDAQSLFGPTRSAATR